MSNKNNSTVEIDVLFLLKKLWFKKFLIIFIALFFGTLSLLGSIFLIKPSYTSTTRIYVVNQNNNNNASNLTAQDLQAGSYLVNDYKEIITSQEVLTKAIEKNKENLTPEELSKMISVAIPTDTRVISISVKNHDAKKASELANSIREAASDKIKDVTKVQDVTTLEAAEVPDEPSSPNIKRNLILGVLVGAFLAIVGVLLSEILDDRIKRPEDVEDVLGMTLIGVIPDINKL
ncbi:CspC family polysaccharide chain length determinant protein [Streptococcus caballi]|uniref:CspC family polysaccharide chain length determinant protein n=1 Tax=Streptococcus caballi TaxID=439220 RepID=UPI0003678E5E|nr:Wzz/FepE/Etk N-terminal domain-containing protein [Streptococcus caballi]